MSNNQIQQEQQDQQNTAAKKKNASSKILTIATLLVLLAIVAVGIYGYAKYVASRSGTAQAQIAQFHFALKNINGDSTATAQSGTINFPITRTDDNKKIDDGKIAPQTYGRFDMIIDGTGSQVAYRYDINVTVTNCPHNLKFYEDKDHQQEITTTRNPANPQPEDNKTATFTISKWVPLNRVNEEHKEIVYWDWAYETGNDANEILANDKLDSADMEKTVTMAIQVVGSQVSGQPAGVPMVGEQPQTISIVKLDVSQVDNTSATLDLGTQAEVILSYTQTPTNLEDLVISSSDSSVATATVDLANNKVVVNALKKGTATITLRGEHSWNITKTIAVTVQGTNVDELVLSSDNSTVSVAPGDTESVTINNFASLHSVEPFTLTSSDNSIATASYDNNGTITVSGVSTGIVTITLSGTLSGTTKIINVKVKKEYKIGDTVNYSTTLNGQTLSDWKVFYKETKNGVDYTYIILGDYLPNAAVSSTVRTTYNLANGDGIYSIKSTTNRTDLINAMATTSNWSDLINNGAINGTALSTEVKSNANVWAMGAPTLDLWVNSWNAKYPSDTLYTKYENPVTGKTFDGWYIGNTENPTTTSIYLSSKTGYGNTLYYPHQAAEQSCNGYWLASPSAYAANFVMYVYYGGSVISGGNSSTRIGFRPVVCLPSSVLE